MNSTKKKDQEPQTEADPAPLLEGCSARPACGIVTGLRLREPCPCGTDLDAEWLMSEASGYPRMVNSDSREPDLVARARQTPDSDGWVTVGLAWAVVDDSGNQGYAVRLHTVPTNWDGNFFLMPPR